MNTLKHPSWSVFLWCLFLLPLSGIARADDGLRDRLERLRDQGKPIVAGVELASARLLDDFYRQRDYRHAWRSGRQVEDLLRLAEASVDEGLQPGDFHARQISDGIAGLALTDFPAATRAEVDILLSDALLRLIHHRRHGKVDPQRLDKRWNHVDGPYAKDLVEDLERAIVADDLQVEVEGLVSRPSFYKRLKRGLARYRGIAASGGWPKVPAGALLKPGMSDPRIPLVRERLRATGDYKGPASDSQEYDKELESALLAFQERHHLGIDAVVGPATLAAMNISVEGRIDQIRVNLERMRWVYDSLPGNLLLVDIAGQEVHFLRGEQLIWSSRAIVGRPDRPTPVFRDQLEYLEINPRWTVPPTILKKDILPAMRKNPGYLRKKGLQVVTRSGKPVSPESVNWYEPAASFPYMIRQPPGARNALGQVKFMFPNRFSVYLHDTPSRNLFSKPRRLFSSGCVRVERPWELAELLLDDPEQWNQATLEKAADSRRTRRLNLDEPLPVILAYWTAEAGKNDGVTFREDVYARDSAVLRALNGRGPIRIVYRDPKMPEPASPAAPEVRKAAAPARSPKTLSQRRPREEELAAY